MKILRATLMAVVLLGAVAYAQVGPGTVYLGSKAAKHTVGMLFHHGDKESKQEKKAREKYEKEREKADKKQREYDKKHHKDCRDCDQGHDHYNDHDRYNKRP
jgi:hypothetical protein